MTWTKESQRHKLSKLGVKTTQNIKKLRIDSTDAFIIIESWKSRFIKIPHLYGIAIGGSVAYRGWSENDVDIIPQFKKSFLNLSLEEQEKILMLVRNKIPDNINGFKTDKGFFEIVNEFGMIEYFGNIDDLSGDDQLYLNMYSTASQMINELDLYREEQPDNIKSVTVFQT
jgi:hypothetical protein